MAAQSQVAQPDTERAKVTITSLLIAVVLGTLLSVVAISGGIYYLVRSGRLQAPAIATIKSSPYTLQSTRCLVLEPLLVNLADASGSAYLRVGLTLRIADTADKATKAKQANADGKTDTDKDAIAALRDTALAVLGRQTSSELLAIDGKEHLKSELRKALVEHNAEIKVTDIYFTEFLVQK